MPNFEGDHSQINTAIAKHRPFGCVSRQHFLLVADISSAVANGNGNGSSHVIAAASRVLDGYGVKVSKDEQEPHAGIIWNPGEKTPKNSGRPLGGMTSKIIKLIIKDHQRSSS